MRCYQTAHMVTIPLSHISVGRHIRERNGMCEQSKWNLANIGMKWPPGALVASHSVLGRFYDVCRLPVVTLEMSSTWKLRIFGSRMAAISTALRVLFLLNFLFVRFGHIFDVCPSCRPQVQPHIRRQCKIIPAPGSSSSTSNKLTQKNSTSLEPYEIPQSADRNSNFQQFLATHTKPPIVKHAQPSYKSTTIKAMPADVF